MGGCRCSSSPVPPTPRRRASCSTATAPRCAAARLRSSSCRRSPTSSATAPSSPAAASSSGRRSCASRGSSRRSRGAPPSTGARWAPLARERVAAGAIAATELRALAASAATDGFARALLRLVDELEEQRVTPQRLTQALRAWAAEDADRRSYADEVSGLYAAYRRRLERLGRRDAPLHAVAALDAVREDPALWGETPVFFYGFDDLSALQRDAIETLAASGARVVLSLAYERGRMAFAGRATTFVELLHDGVEHIALKARAEHYAEAARAPLHHLERELFELEPEGRLFEPDPVDPGTAVTLLQGGGERAELELVGAEIVRLIAEEGFAAEEIAVVLRDPAPAAALLTEVFGALGVPVAIDRRAAFGHTALGRGLVALLRCALLDATATAQDLLAWLRTPGLLHRPELADGLEARARQQGARSAAAARELWEAEHWKLDAIDRLRAAQARGPAELLERIADELATLFAAPRRRAAEVLTGPAAQDGDVLVRGTQGARGAAVDRRAGPLARADSGPARDAALRARGARRHAPGARLRDGHRAAGAARAARAGAVCLRPAGGRVPGRAGRRAVLRRRRARADRRRLRPAPAPPRRPRRRALPLLRDGLAARGAPVSLLARGRRRRRAGRAVVLSSPMSATSSAPGLWERRRMRTLGEVGWPAQRPELGASGCGRRRRRGRATARRRSPRSATRRSSASCASARRGRRRRSSCGRAAR